jgi:hypothetical protein
MRGRDGSGEEHNRVDESVRRKHIDRTATTAPRSPLSGGTDLRTCTAGCTMFPATYAHLLVRRRRELRRRLRRAAAGRHRTGRGRGQEKGAEEDGEGVGRVGQHCSTSG